MSKTITFDLSPHSIKMAIEQLNSYQRDFSRKVEAFRQRVAEEIARVAGDLYSVSIVDDTLSVPPQRADVTVTSQEDGENVTLVIAQGKDAIWVEFGAGIYHNGSAGSSPNPNGARLGFTIGSMGPNGLKRTWGFMRDGELVLTHGTRARMPMYTAMTEVCANIDSIAREVFG